MLGVGIGRPADKRASHTLPRCNLGTAGEADAVSLAAHIPLNHARDYLRQHFAVAAGLEPMDYRPLGSIPDGDPDVRRSCLEMMNQCRDRAHESLAGCIAAAKIPVWGAQDDGQLGVVAPDWAAKCFDGEDGLRADGLYLARDAFTELVRSIAPEESRRHLTENYGSLWASREFDPSRVEPNAIRWDDYEQSDHIELEQLSKQAAKDQWWTWPEAIAWIGERDCDNIATLRFWASRWRGDGDPTVAIAAQDYIARQYCESPSEAEAALIASIESGIVKSHGRSSRDGLSAPLDKGHWRGGTVVYSEGTAQLASATNKLIAWAFDIAVDRADLMREFPGEGMSERSNLGIQNGQAIATRANGWESIATPGPVTIPSGFIKLSDALFELAGSIAAADTEYRVLGLPDGSDALRDDRWIRELHHTQEAEQALLQALRGAALHSGLHAWTRREPHIEPELLDAALFSSNEWIQHQSFVLSMICTYPTQRYARLEGWPLFLRKEDWQRWKLSAGVSSVLVPPAARRRGRTPGSGTYANADATLLAEMKVLIDAGKANSPDGAAKMVAAKAAGFATIESKASRLARAYRVQSFGE